MDLQEYITNKVNCDRVERMKTSNQLTLGELILKLEPLIAKQKQIKKKYDEEASMRFDFEFAYPTGLSSWRGSYNELAINFSFVGYGMEGYTTIKGFEPKEPTITEFLKMLKEAVGKTYTGWKGGDFVMGKSTPLWVSNDGNGGNTGVVDVIDNDYEIILVTDLFDY